jgi:hypothetical protein
MNILEEKEEDEIIDTNGNEYEIAKLLFVIFKDKYKYNNDIKKWYSLSLNKINDINDINDIKRYLSEDLCKRFMMRGIYYMNMMSSTSDEGQKEVYSRKSSAASKISLKLKQDGYKSRILKELSYMLI